MKQDIKLGAYGWSHAHWLETFYPADLPEDWQLTYYSNEFNCVLVPADYWRPGQKPDIEDWLDNVHPGFQFLVECHVSMLDSFSLAELTGYLKSLQPQLSALVFLEERQPLSLSRKEQFISLFETLQVEVFASGSLLESLSGVPVKAIWREQKPQSSSLAFIEKDLSDLRSARMILDDFVSQLQEQEPSSQATVIVSHPQMQVSDLKKFRSVIEIMGY